MVDILAKKMDFWAESGQCSARVGIRIGVFLLLRLIAFYLRRLAYFFKGLEQGGDVRLIGVVGDGDGFGLKVADDVFHSFLKGDILHDFVATTLAMQVA